MSESLLTNSFDDQIKLVEKSIAEERMKNKKSSNTNNNLPGTEDSQKQDAKQTYTNRSRIYRFDLKEHVPIVPPTTVPVTDPPKNETDARASMLMSWYMAGYQTGYYDAMKRYGDSDG